MAFDHETDVVVVGSGSAALTAALAAVDAGLDVLVLESTDLVGGSSGMSGGGAWIPNNPLMRAAGVPDSIETARKYLDLVVGDVGPASSPERRDAFLTQGPAMVDWLTDLGFAWRYGRGYSDYYPELPGGSVQGRAVEGETFDIKQLGPWAGRVRTLSPLPLHTNEAWKFAVSFRTWTGFSTAAKVIAGRTVGNMLIGRKPVAGGASVIAQLLHLLLRREVQVWTESPMLELITDAGDVTGVVVAHEEGTVRIGARRGVMLAAGGFSRNDAMRQEHHPHPIGTDWTVAAPGDNGDAIRAGAAAGAQTALMDDAWWGPSFVDHTGAAGFMLWERSLPFGFIVDSTGRRFMNESASYVDCGHAQYERNAEVPAIPAYLIIDSRHRRYYPFGMMLPGITPKAALESGFVTKADSLAELAAACGIDPDGLRETTRRFAGFAREGVDEDFGRGNSVYDRLYSDPRVTPNPNLGAVARPPFYAVRVYPGDLGTKGGLLTDEHARVLRPDGSVIGGLYAAGNSSASVMGRTYPGPGSTIGPAMVFGMLGGRHMASR